MKTNEEKEGIKDAQNNHLQQQYILQYYDEWIGRHVKKCLGCSDHNQDGIIVDRHQFSVNVQMELVAEHLIDIFFLPGRSTGE